jgi:hypothetical protein
MISLLATGFVLAILAACALNWRAEKRLLAAKGGASDGA